MLGYAELQVTSNFDFLRGASHPEELAVRAASLGLKAIAITDCNTLAGVVRAHLIDELAGALEAWKLDPQIAYLSGDRTVDTPFARCYRVLRHVPFNLKSLRRLLGREGWRPTAIKKRRFPITPDELERLLRLEGTGEPVTLIATRIAERPVVAVCEPVVFSADSDRPHWSEKTPS